MGFPTNMKTQNSPSYYATNPSNHFLKGWFSGRTRRVIAGNTAKRGGGLEVEEVGWGKGKDFFGKPN
jgi:hypothetical protein